MTGSMVAFAINDAFLRSIGGGLPVFQTLTLRGLLVVTFLAALVWATGTWVPQRLTRREKWLLVARSVTEIGAAFFIVNALFNMELAKVTAILQILPLTIPLAIWLFLREPMGWRRMVAIGIGFVGMLLIVQPGGPDYSVYSLYCLGAVVCVTARDVLSRRLGHKVSSSLISFYSALSVLLFAAVATQFETWEPVGQAHVWALLGSSVAILLGYVFSVMVMRTGEVGFTAQFRYMGLIAALVIGYLAFGEWPNVLTLCGAAIVVTTGLFTLLRERQLQNAD